MRFAVFYSKKDLAGINIKKQLNRYFLPQIPIFELKKETIYSENLDSFSLKNIDFIIFASKHKSKEKRKTLSLHAPGNWRSADFGGKPGKVCLTSAFVLKYLFKKLNENINQLPEYEATLECTHHGPYIKKPCCFIEIGSEEEQWKDEKAAEVIAKTISSLQDYGPNPEWIPAIGIGGPHYCPNFNKVQLNSNYAIGHIIPQYALPLTKNMLQEAEEKTKEQVQIVLLDWKGLGKSEDRNKIKQILEESGLKFKKTSRIKKQN